MKRKKGFTLIELLVVISIIAVLAAILMPALGRAREMAKSSACVSNLHNIGLTLHMYTADNRGYFPVCYKYLDGNGSSSGYYHWTAQIDSGQYTDPVDGYDDVNGVHHAARYPQTSDQYVCPSHDVGGWAPTSFTFERIPEPPAGQATQHPGIDDKQVPRLSYIPNESIMPRKKYSAAHDQDPLNTATTSHLCQVSADEITAPERTILVGEFSQSPNCILGSSVGGGTAYKSHRPTNAIWCDTYTAPNGDTNCFDGELWDQYILPAKEAGNLEVYKLTYDQAMSEISTVLNDPAAGQSGLYSHIAYIDDNAHRTGSNCLFVDGHVAKYTLDKTMDPRNWMWGDKIYSCVEKPVLQDPTGSGQLGAP